MRIQPLPLLKLLLSFLPMLPPPLRRSSRRWSCCICSAAQAAPFHYFNLSTPWAGRRFSARSRFAFRGLSAPVFTSWLWDDIAARVMWVTCCGALF